MESEAPPIYECALAELLAEGVARDVRPLLTKWIELPKALAEVYQKLSPAQAELARSLLPADDAARHSWQGFRIRIRGSWNPRNPNPADQESAESESKGSGILGI